MLDWRHTIQHLCAQLALDWFIVVGSPQALLQRQSQPDSSPAAAIDMPATDANREGLLTGQPLRFTRTAPAADRTVDTASIIAGAKAKARIEIWNAIIDGPLDLANTTFEAAVMFIRCEFQERAVFSHASFMQGLVLSGTIFHKGANFANATIEGDARLNGARFLSGRSAFDAMHVSGNFLANNVCFKSSVRPNFRGSTIAKSAFFRNAVFDAGADFYSAHIVSDAIYDGSEFKGRANFSLICIDGNARFVRTTFHHDVDASFARIQSVGLFQGAVFKQKAVFTGAKFLGNVHFGEAEVPKCNTARFEQEAYFSLAEVASLADFNNVTFAGTTWFTGAQFSSTCLFRGARFKTLVSFNSAKFSGPALFGEIQLSGVAHCRAAIFEGAADFISAQFALLADFQKAECCGRTSFDSAVFAGNALFTEAHFRDGATLSFSFARFEGDATFVRASFEANASFFYTAFRTLRFSETPAKATRFLLWEFMERIPKPGQEQFKGSLDLRGCTYDRIEVDWKPLLRYVDAAESEKEVSGSGPAGEIREIAEAVHHRPGESRLRPYDRQPYAQLEKAFREAGRTDEADRVYLERRRVERQRMRFRFNLDLWDYPHEYPAEQDKPQLHEVFEHSEPRPDPRATLAHALASAVAGFGDWIYWRGARYGVRPLRLLVFAAVLLSWGAIVFHSPGAVHSKAAPTPANQVRQAAAACSDHVKFSEAARLSLREFSPIDLPLLKDCEPSEKTAFHLRVSDWATMLRITGWIIVPVGIAALTGLLRRAAH